MLKKFRTVVTAAFVMSTLSVGCDLNVNIPELEDDDEGEDDSEGDMTDPDGDGDGDGNSGDDDHGDDDHGGGEPGPLPCEDEVFACYDDAWIVCEGGMPGPEPEPEPWSDDHDPMDPNSDPGQGEGTGGMEPGGTDGGMDPWPGGGECEQALQACEELELACWGDPGDPPPVDPCEDVVIECHDEAYYVCEQDPQACDGALEQCNIIAEECWGDLDPDPDVDDPCFAEVDECFDHVMQSCEQGDADACDAGILECEALAQECGGGGEVPPCFDEVDACFGAADQACSDAMDPYACEEAYAECDVLLEVCAC